MPKPITVRLVGGLGNQLFGYYAGAALAAHHGTTLRIDTSWTRHGITDHGIDILDFDLPGEWLTSRSWTTQLAAPGSLQGRAAAWALRRSALLRRPLRIHEAPGIGHDPTLLEQPPGTHLRGHFQSWLIVDAAVKSGLPRRPGLRRPSTWVVDMRDRALAEKPIAVHVRRGDYARVDDFGLLGPGYYEPAIARLQALGLTGPLWLFSDEPDVARQALGTFGPEARIVRSPGRPPTEMLAMSYGAGIVAANSTFSWWAAWMSEPSVPKIIPEPWFRSGPRVQGLIPPSWEEVKFS